ncbi:MAG: bifunctional UDP-3-O-[3-hydroxymyristoyl] N-acetylglucosamine deacetylase/3-hydroxyacyl-ACP dehydratase [Gemmatimonadota bacterium]|jgi:UDP-3-O-[3-hydroxymyristoyl] N-acetylglucosamine deacetylase/3-hydroxyacyl-[acyl-carrier-protein] dehydratase
MSSGKQRTVAKEITLDGIGVHSGESASLTFHPAGVDHGVRFRRADVDGEPEIPATLDHVVRTDLGTTLGLEGVEVLTVEHLMAALASQSVDNVVVELTGPEIPIRDGSFRDYVAALRDVGFEEQDAEARRVTVRAPVVSDGREGESYVATPGEGLRISGTIDFAHPSIGRQFGTFVVDADAFEGELAPARTFGFVRDWDALRERGLAQGANLTNTVVLDEDEILNDGLRFPDEFLRHKVGDVVGDMALLGARLDAHLVTERPSHAGNVAMARAIAEHARRAGRDAIVDVAKIMEYLPHRFPMLLVDRIIDFEPGKRIVGIKNVTINEPFFQGHYPGHPIMPGVLIIEAMAQVGGLLLMEEVENPDEKVVYFMTMDNVKWRRPVTPGDTLVFELEMIQYRRHTCKMRGQGFVDGHLVAEADFMARIVDR